LNNIGFETHAVVQTRYDLSFMLKTRKTVFCNVRLINILLDVAGWTLGTEEKITFQSVEPNQIEEYKRAFSSHSQEIIRTSHVLYALDMGYMVRDKTYFEALINRIDDISAKENGIINFNQFVMCALVGNQKKEEFQNFYTKISDSKEKAREKIGEIEDIAEIDKVIQAFKNDNELHQESETFKNALISIQRQGANQVLNQTSEKLFDTQDTGIAKLDKILEAFKNDNKIHQESKTYRDALKQLKGMAVEAATKEPFFKLDEAISIKTIEEIFNEFKEKNQSHQKSQTYKNAFIEVEKRAAIYSVEVIMKEREISWRDREKWIDPLIKEFKQEYESIEPLLYQNIIRKLESFALEITDQNNSKDDMFLQIDINNDKELSKPELRAYAAKRCSRELSYSQHTQLVEALPKLSEEQNISTFKLIENHINYQMSYSDSEEMRVEWENEEELKNKLLKILIGLEIEAIELIMNYYGLQLNMVNDYVSHCDTNKDGIVSLEEWKQNSYIP